MENTFQIPIPKDIMLGFPAPRFDLEILIVLLFLIHILFINLMLGASVLTVIYEIAGLTKKEYDKLAEEIAGTITVNKSMGVVFGVAPLLAINVLYTVYFYSSNALTGTVWFLLVPLIGFAFVIGYLHKYTWERLASQKVLHILLGATQAVLFLIIPLVFLANVNLMLFPEKWADVHGWLSTLMLPNVFPRYFHFILACIALTGLFLAIYFGRNGYPVEEKFETLTRPILRRHFFAIAFWASLAQFIVGPLLFLTLPGVGLSWSMTIMIFCGAILAAFALWFLWKEITAGDAVVGGKVWLIIALLTGTVCLMGYGRHLYREEALDDHMKLVQENTTTFMAISKVAKWRDEQGLGGLGGAEKLPLGQRVFKNVCSACHMMDKRLVGPPLLEIAELYTGDPEGITNWVKKPGKRRADYPPMQAIKLSAKQYQAVSQYVLDAVEEHKNPTAAENVQSATETIDSATQMN
jgi:cytochrome c